MSINSTLKRRENLYEKIYNKGIDINTAKKYTIKEWNSNFGTKIRKKSSLAGQKRLLDQIRTNRENIVNFHIKKNKITNPNVIEHHRKESVRLLTKEIKKEKLPSKPKAKAPQKEGDYNTTLIIDGSEDKKYIKWTNIKDFNRQLEKIKNHYGFIKVGKTTTHSYKEFKSPEYIKLAKEYGIEP